MSSTPGCPPIQILDILSVPYPARKLIQVEDDWVVSQKRRFAQNRVEKDALNVGSCLAELGLLGVLAPSLHPAATVAVLAGVWAMGKKRPVDRPNILEIARSEADVLQLPVGHPCDRIVYAAHPGVPRSYYPVGDFHRSVFEHKLCEAVTLLMSLRATQLKVEYARGWDRSFAVNLGVPLGTASANGNARSSDRLLFEATLKPGRRKPQVPENLVWFPREATWQVIARGRLEDNLAALTLNVAYLSDFDVNLKLKSRINRAGLEIGGKFQNHRETIWRIEARF